MNNTNKPQSNIFVNAQCLPLSSVCDYTGRRGLDKAVISNGKIVNIVSDKYGFLPNDRFFTVIENQLTSLGYSYEKRYQNFEDRYFTADYIFHDAKFNIKTVTRANDHLKPQLRFINSYDGSCKTAGHMSFFRQICSNGLHGLTTEIAFKLKHSGNIQELVLPNIAEMIEKYTNHESVNIIRRYEVLAEKNITDVTEFIKLVCENTNVFRFDISDKNPDASINTKFVEEVIAREVDTLQMQPNAWIVYNAFNEWLYNNERNKKHEAVRQGLDARLVNFLEQVN